MERTPLFVQFANGVLSPEKVASRFAEGTSDPQSKEIALKLAGGEGVYDVETFRDDFRNCLLDFMDNGPIPPVVQYLDAYMGASLEEVSSHEGRGSYGTSSRYAVIKDGDSPWVEAVVCYNFCIYLKAYGKEELKCCKTCKKFFVNKGKYATYCSEGCKSRKVQ